MEDETMSSLKNNYGRITNSEFGFVLRNMTIDGAFGGDPNAAVDGSITPVDFFTQPPPGFQFIVSQLALEISDSGSRGLEDYGSISGPLTNGVQLFIEKNSVKVDFGLPIKTNQEVITLFPVLVTEVFTAGVTLNLYSFDILTHSKSPVVLNGETGDKFGLTIQDDLSTLAAHAVSIKGNMRLTVV